MSEITLKSLLPEIYFEVKETMSEGELFQNKTLRPILKYQSAGLCRLTLMYCFQMNPAFGTLSAAKKRKMVSDLLSGNQALRNQLTGMIISFFKKKKSYPRWIIFLSCSRLSKPGSITLSFCTCKILPVFEIIQISPASSCLSA